MILEIKCGYSKKLPELIGSSKNYVLGWYGVLRLLEKQCFIKIATLLSLENLQGLLLKTFFKSFNRSVEMLNKLVGAISNNW